MLKSILIIIFGNAIAGVDCLQPSSASTSSYAGRGPRNHYRARRDHGPLKTFEELPWYIRGGHHVVSAVTAPLRERADRKFEKERDERKKTLYSKPTATTDVRAVRKKKAPPNNTPPKPTARRRVSALQAGVDPAWRAALQRDIDPVNQKIFGNTDQAGDTWSFKASNGGELPLAALPENQSARHAAPTTRGPLSTTIPERLRTEQV